MYRSEIKITGKISPTFCHKSNNFVKIWTKRAWNYFLISLVAIWWHIDRKPGWLKKNSSLPAGVERLKQEVTYLPEQNKLAIV